MLLHRTVYSVLRPSDVIDGRSLTAVCKPAVLAQPSVFSILCLVSLSIPVSHRDDGQAGASQGTRGMRPPVCHSRLVSVVLVVGIGVVSGICVKSGISNSYNVT